MNLTIPLFFGTAGKRVSGSWACSYSQLSNNEVQWWVFCSCRRCSVCSYLPCSIFIIMFILFVLNFISFKVSLSLFLLRFKFSWIYSFFFLLALCFSYQGLLLNLDDMKWLIDRYESILIRPQIYVNIKIL